MLATISGALAEELKVKSYTKKDGTKVDAWEQRIQGSQFAQFIARKGLKSGDSFYYGVTRE